MVFGGGAGSARAGPDDGPEWEEFVSFVFDLFSPERDGVPTMEGFWPCTEVSTRRTLDAVREARARHTGARATRYLDSIESFLQKTATGFQNRRELTGGVLPVLQSDVVVAADVAALFQDFPMIPPYTGLTPVLPTGSLLFTVCEKLALTYQDWGVTTDSRTVLGFLERVDPTLVTDVHFLFHKPARTINSAPLVEVLRKWERLERLTFSCFDDQDMGSTLEDLVLELKPKRVRLMGWSCTKYFRRANQFEGLQEIKTVLPLRMGVVPDTMLQLFGALPQTVRKFSLRVQSFNKDEATKCLNQCLQVLPAHINDFEVCGVDFWDDPDSLHGIFGHGRFESLSFFDSEDTSLRLLPRRQSHLLFDLVKKNCRARFLNTCQFSSSIQTVLRASDIEEFTFKRPFYVKDESADFDHLKVGHTVRKSSLKAMTYRGVPAHYVLDLEQKVAGRAEAAAQRGLSVLFSCLQLRETHTTSLGSIPPHVLQPAVEQSAVLFADNNKQHDEDQDLTAMMFFNLVQVVREENWLKDLPKIPAQFEDFVGRYYGEFDILPDWHLALHGLCLFLTFAHPSVNERFKAYREKLDDAKFKSFLQNYRADQKRDLENSPSSERPSKQPRESD